MLGASILALQTVLLTGASLAPTPAAAQAGPGTIVNPLNDEVLTIDTDLGGVVLTENNLLIVVDPMVGDAIVDPADENNTLTITSLIRAIDPDTGDPTGNVIQFVATDGGDPPTLTTIDVVRDATSIVEDLIRQGEDGVVPGDPGGPFIIPPANGDQNTVRNIDVGKGGEGGRLGVGVRVCFIVCGTVGQSATDGERGENGLPITADSDDVGNIVIRTEDRLSAGVIIASIGGDGGQGGDAAIQTPTGNGGRGGNGGRIDIVSAADIITDGAIANGIRVQSRGGGGGRGGIGVGIDIPAGDGGRAGDGGSATATNAGSIVTNGDGSIGLLVQSLGGFAGDGGSSFGIVGTGGSSGVAGNGGAAIGNNDGSILTGGLGAHGVMAQSIGGSGGDAGDAAGLFADAASGSSGGVGGSATARNRTGASIRTQGEGAFGLFAQSIGGGGGNGGSASGAVALGGSGGAGANGGSATVENQADARIVTLREGAVGVFAQSVGGGGGSGGNSGGAISFGGSGGSGGTGGGVTAYNRADAEILTTGDAAYGIFAQSVGGGGGNGGVSAATAAR